MIKKITIISFIYLTGLYISIGYIYLHQKKEISVLTKRTSNMQKEIYYDRKQIVELEGMVAEVILNPDAKQGKALLDKYYDIRSEELIVEAMRAQPGILEAIGEIRNLRRHIDTCSAKLYSNYLKVYNTYYKKKHDIFIEKRREPYKIKEKQRK